MEGVPTKILCRATLATLSYSKTGNKNVQLATLRAESPSIFLNKSRKIEGDSARRVHCCRTSQWIAMLRFFPPTFEPALRQRGLQGFFSWVIKCATSNVIQLVLHDGCKTNCAFFVACFIVLLDLFCFFGRSRCHRRLALHNLLFNFVWVNCIGILVYLKGTRSNVCVGG